ncbi:MAG: hypothetical protein CL949_12810 [Erythrobacter sp.]|nr:hypothetical protein [Erythrobacter sp.]|tara:strand:- start:157 stop:777 length:621 start_codon:yes stop_codon:yes gene_type:complete
MKTIAPAALAALDRGDAIVVGAIEIAADPVSRVWGGPWPITFDGRTFEPLGDRTMVQVASGALGGQAQSITLTLSGLEPELLELLEAAEVAGAPTTLWRLIFDSSGTVLLGYNVWGRGRLDTLDREEEIGGTATITAKVETPARSMGKRGARMRSDADQRLIDPDDGFFKHVAYAGEKKLYWGGRAPERAGSVLSDSIRAIRRAMR